MKRLTCLVFVSMLAMAVAQSQTVIREVTRVVSGKEIKISHDVIDTEGSLRIYWDRDALQKKLAEIGTPADVGEEIQHAGKLADISRRGVAAVDEFTRAVAADPRQAYGAAVAKLGAVLNEAIKAVPNDYQRLQSAFTGAIQTAANDEDRRANIARASAAVFSELAKLSVETYQRTAAKLKATNVNFWVVANASRDQDSTRRREVPFLSPLTGEDIDALNSIKSFADNFGGEPSGLLKAELGLGQQATKKVISDAKAALETQLQNLKSDWQALFDKYRNNQAVATELNNLKTAVEALESKFTQSITSLQQNLVAIRDGDPDTRSDAIARLQEASAALSSARTTVSSLGEFGARVTDVKVAFQKLLDAIGSTGEQAVVDFKAFVEGLPMRLEELAGAMVGIAKGSIQTLYDALGIGLHMKLIAGVVQAGDPSKEYADLELTSNGAPLRLYAGDEVVVGVKMAKGDTPPASFTESRRLYVYPNRWTSDRIIPIVFTQRDDINPNTDTRNRSWKFSPTYMDVFKRYSVNRSADSNRWLTPGLGIAITALDQNGDDSYEIGLGAGLTLFDDRLIAGIGFNTQRSRSYMFFGLRLRLSDIGIRN